MRVVLSGMISGGVAGEGPPAPLSVWLGLRTEHRAQRTENREQRTKHQILTTAPGLLGSLVSGKRRGAL